MATDKDTQLANEILTQQIEILRFSAGEKARAMAILKRMEEDLIDQLLHAKLTDIGRADKAALLRQAQAVIEQAYGDITDQVAASMVDAADITAGATADAIGTAFRGYITPALPPPVFFKKLVDDTLIQGAPSADWWSRQAANTAWRFQTEVAQGLAENESNDQIIRRIRGRAVGWSLDEDGKRVYRYEGGVMSTSRKDAASLVQTSVQTAANSARRETFQANSDVIKGIRQISTLDGHTSVICVAYSGAAWDLSYKPIAPTTLDYNGGVPRHWNCRSVEVPITKTFKELGIDIPEFESTTRAASGGPLSAKVEFDNFLKQKEAKGPGFTDDLLGAGRAELWRDGKITLQQLLDQSGRPLSVAELRKRYDK
jgi:hypothetical protein